MSDLFESLNLTSTKNSLINYRACIANEIANVPIETLCLPKAITTILKREKYLRISDLLGVKLHTIKSISNARADIISQKLRIFFSYDI